MSYTMLVDPVRYPMLHLSTRCIDVEVPQPELCRLLSLPVEIKLGIVTYIERKRDLYNLSLTCRNMEHLTYRTLYKTVDVEIPQSKYMSWNLDKLPTFRSHVLESMQELTIRNGFCNLRDPVYSKRRKSNAGSVDNYVCDLIEQTPQDQLRSFSFLHQSPLSTRMLRSLAESHGERLEHLRCFELEKAQSNLTLPKKLHTLECRSISSGEAVGEMVEANRQTLERLHMGQERDLVDQYRRNRLGYLDQIPQPLDSFRAEVNFNTLPNLRHLALVGMQLSPLLPRSIDSALHFCGLESLTLESCAGAADFLDALSSTFQYAQFSDMAPTNPRRMPSLVSFVFRHEAFTNLLKDALINFLASFSGLQMLSLLFENTTLIERPSTLIANHGTTLKTLVLESRIQPREHLGLDTSRPLGLGGYTNQVWQESIDDICISCPNLVELGMGFPWDDEMVRLRKTKLPHLKNLKTIHIRNFPQSQVLSQLGDYAVQEYARKFIEWCFPSLVGGVRPSLETLAIGPTLYESRWKYNPTSTSSTLADSVQAANYRRCHNPPQYLKSHHYCIDWAKTRFGRWNALITPVSERYMEELREEKPLSGVFEQVWLR